MPDTGYLTNKHGRIYIRDGVGTVVADFDDAGDINLGGIAPGNSTVARVTQRKRARAFVDGEPAEASLSFSFMLPAADYIRANASDKRTMLEALLAVPDGNEDLVTTNPGAIGPMCYEVCIEHQVVGRGGGLHAAVVRIDEVALDESGDAVQISVTAQALTGYELYDPKVNPPY